MGLYLTSFFCGGVMMLLEVLGFRLLPPYFGYSIHVWASLIGVMLIGLAVGYYVGGLLADRCPRPELLYVMVLVAAAYDAFVLISYPVILGFASRFPLDAGSLLAAVCLFAAPMALLATVSPFVIRLLVEAGTVGRTTGRIYAVSTVGSIAGTFLTSFYLLPAVGIRATLTLSCLTLTLVGGVGLVASGVRVARRKELARTS